MNFSDALLGIQSGRKLGRSGWNGQGMFVFLVPGSTFKVNREPLMGIFPVDTQITYHAHIDMRTADGSIMVWTPSQSDLLSNDWVYVW